MAFSSTPTFSNSTFTNIGGAVSDLFAGFGAQAQGSLQAQGLRITAAGTLITARGTMLNAEALRLRAQGDLAEASNYDLAAGLARANEAYTEQSTRIQQAQLERQVTQATGGLQAAVGGAGFAAGGSAGDLMRESASQGALAKGVLAQQGVITQAGFEEQARSFDTMSAAGRATAAGEMDMATQTEGIAADQRRLAGMQSSLADQTQRAGENAGIGDFISGAVRGVAAVASMFIV